MSSFDPNDASDTASAASGGGDGANQTKVGFGATGDVTANSNSNNTSNSNNYHGGTVNYNGMGKGSVVAIVTAAVAIVVVVATQRPSPTVIVTQGTAPTVNNYTTNNAAIVQAPAQQQPQTAGVVIQQSGPTVSIQHAPPAPPTVVEAPRQAPPPKATLVTEEPTLSSAKGTRAMAMGPGEDFVAQPQGTQKVAMNTTRSREMPPPPPPPVTIKLPPKPVDKSTEPFAAGVAILTGGDGNVPEQQVRIADGVIKSFALCDSGEFDMGDSPAERAELRHMSVDGDLPPSRHVKIEQPFWMARYETTEREYYAVMGGGTAPSEPANPMVDNPIGGVSWQNANAFCEKLTAGQTLWKFRLPTEEEWEYACRAGTTTPYSFGTQLNGVEAACDGTKPYPSDFPKGASWGRVYPVGTFHANPWGLYNMHGNVAEWVADSLVDPVLGKVHVLRGGSTRDYARKCRSASRAIVREDQTDTFVGFRVIMVPAGVTKK